MPLTRTRRTHSPHRAASRGCDAATPGSMAVAIADAASFPRRSPRVLCRSVVVLLGAPACRCCALASRRQGAATAPYRRTHATRRDGQRAGRTTCGAPGQPRATARHLNGQWEWGNRLANRTRIGVRIAEVARMPVRNRGNCAGEYTRNTRGIHEEYRDWRALLRYLADSYLRFRRCIEAIRAIRHPPQASPAWAAGAGASGVCPPPCMVELWTESSDGRPLQH